MTNLEAYHQLRELATDATVETTKATIALLQTALAVSVAVAALLLAFVPARLPDTTPESFACAPCTPCVWEVSVGIAALCIATSAISLFAFWVALVRDREQLRALRDKLETDLQNRISSEHSPYDGPSTFITRVPTIFAYLAVVVITLLAILGLLLSLLAILCF